MATREELLRRKQQILQRLVAIEQTKGSTETPAETQQAPADTSAQQTSDASTAEDGGFFAALGKAFGGKRRFIPGLNISFPDTGVPIGMGQPTAGELAGGMRKLPGEVMETGGQMLATGQGLAFDPQARQQAIEGLKESGRVLGRGGLDIVTGQDTEEAEAIKTGAKDILSSLGNVALEPGQSFEESPLETLAIGRTFLGAADPFSLAGSALAKGAKGAANKFARGMTAVSGNRTGTGQRAADIAREIGQEEGFSGPRTDIFKAAQSGETSPMQLVEKVAQAGGMARKFRNDRFDKQMAAIQKRNPGKTFDINDIEVDLFDKVESAGLDIFVDPKTGITVRPKINSDWVGVTDELGPINDMIEIVNNWTDNSITGIHKLRKNIDKLRGKTGDFSSRADLDNLIESARGVVDKRLKSVEGFAKMDKDWSEAMAFLNSMERNLGIRRKKGSGTARIDEVELPDVTENMFTKIGNLLNDRTSNNLELRRAIVDELDKILEKETGVKSSIVSELAGQIQSKEAAQGLAGKANRSAFSPLGSFGGAGGGAFMGGAEAIAGAAIGNYTMMILRRMTIDNPKSMATFFRGLGATERKVKQIENFVSDLRKRSPVKRGEQALTVGVLWDRLNRGEEEEDMLSNLGRINRDALASASIPKQ